MPIPRTPDQNQVYTLVTGADDIMVMVEVVSQHSHGASCDKSIAHNCYQAIKKYAKAVLVACAIPEPPTSAIEQLLTLLQTNSTIRLTRHELAEVAILEEFDTEWTSDSSGKAHVFEADDSLIIARNFRDKLRPLAWDFLKN